MEKEVACKIEGMMIASRAYLEALADAVGQTLSTEERRNYIKKIGCAITELIDASRMLYDAHPDLDPHSAETQIAASMRSERSPADEASQVSRYLEM